MGERKGMVDEVRKPHDRKVSKDVGDCTVAVAAATMVVVGPQRRSRSRSHCCWDWGVGAGNLDGEGGMVTVPVTAGMKQDRKAINL